MKQMPNRGRFQAQGQTLEKSESWSQENPIYYCEAKVLVVNLKSQLTKRELKTRERAFKECEAYIAKANQNGGLNGFHSKSFPKNFKERVDLEVHLGLAFKTKPETNEK